MFLSNVQFIEKNMYDAVCKINTTFINTVCPIQINHFVMTSQDKVIIAKYISLFEILNVLS